MMSITDSYTLTGSWNENAQSFKAPVFEYSWQYSLIYEAKERGTHVSVFCHWVEFEEERTLNNLTHLRHSKTITSIINKKNQMYPNEGYILPTCLWIWISDWSGGPPVVYQPKNSMSLKTCLTEQQKKIQKQVSDITHQLQLEMEYLLMIQLLLPLSS